MDASGWGVVALGLYRSEDTIRLLPQHGVIIQGKYTCVNKRISVSQDTSPLLRSHGIAFELENFVSKTQ